MCKHDASFSEEDCLWSCSHWTYDDASPSHVITRFVSSLTESMKANKRAGIDCTTIPYGEDETEQIDVFGSLEVAQLIVVWLHGGYWQEGSRADCSPLVLPLVRRGVTVASIGYRLASPDRPVGDIVRDVAKAIKMLLDRFANTPRRLILGAHSAGAQLAFKASQLLASTSPVDGLALFSGVFDLSRLPDTVIGRPIGLTAATAEEACCRVLPGTVPSQEVLLAVAAEDSPALLEQSTRMCDELEKAGTTAQHIVIDGEDHFSLISHLSDASSQQAQILAEFCLKATNN